MSLEQAMFEHFLAAQEPVYTTALAELRAGRKQSHWMWFIFPQIAGLGQSEMSRRFALASLAQARAYLDHPVLGARLRECTGAVLIHAGKLGAHAIFGTPDDVKFFSSMTLFAHAAPADPVFSEALATFFGGLEDRNTLERIS